MQCSRLITAELYTRQCEREAHCGPDNAYCRSCAWVLFPEMRETLPPRLKTKKRKPLETPWARKLFEPFTKWFTRAAWPVGSVLLRRNTVGQWALPGGRIIKAGLGKGTADYIGFKSVIVTQDMVGKRVAIFLSAEAKRDGIDLEGRQLRWHEVVIENGGISLRAAPETKQAALALLRAAVHGSVPDITSA